MPALDETILTPRDLRSRRRRLGLSADKLAARSGITSRTIGAIEREERPGGWSTLAILNTVLHKLEVEAKADEAA
jgi:transcriptional regulator with XRE-family HTH domain